jgi:2-polyprenyl-3-methyl-5-hydroxy-6-metoxy-1,4-benzoquinol methylase
MDITANRPCPVCAATNVTVLHKMDFELPKTSPLPRQYQVVYCHACGMVYADSVAGQQDYDLYYEQFSKYEDTKTASGGGYTAADRARLDDMATLLAKHLTKTDSIVDIGCANGGLLEALSVRGFSRLTGIDPSSASIRHIHERGFHGYSLKIADLNKEAVGTYQGIILSHVMEHVFDVAAAMKTIRTLLDEEGLLYLEVPNALKYSSHYVVPFYYFDAEHINHFDGHALENLAGIHGFEVLAKAEKTIPASSAIDYPAVYVILRKQLTLGSYDVDFSDHLESGIRHYITKSKQDGRLDIIDGYAANGKSIILWGAGSYTQRLLATTKLRNCNIAAIVDSDNKKQGLFIHSIPIQDPAVLRKIDGVILISAALYVAEIKKDILAMGLKNEVNVLG